MANPIIMYRIDIGFDPGRGYAAVILDVANSRQKGIKGNSIQQLTSRLRHVLNEEGSKRTNFPLESETSKIITPNGFE
jgi:hypothetical protein